MFSIFSKSMLALPPNILLRMSHAPLYSGSTGNARGRQGGPTMVMSKLNLPFEGLGIYIFIIIIITIIIITIIIIMIIYYYDYIYTSVCVGGTLVRT